MLHVYEILYYYYYYYWSASQLFYFCFGMVMVLSKYIQHHSNAKVELLQCGLLLCFLILMFLILMEACLFSSAMTAPLAPKGNHTFQSLPSSDSTNWVSTPPKPCLTVCSASSSLQRHPYFLQIPFWVSAVGGLEPFCFWRLLYFIGCIHRSPLPIGGLQVINQV